jgi:hypothetical protein
MLASHESEAQEVINHRLERPAGATALFRQQTGDIVVNGEGCSHIMMLSPNTS